MTQQGLLKASGVVLARSQMGEGGLWLTLFLKGQGLLRASAPGAERGRVRFGGGTEPFVWGAFHLHRGRGGGLYLSGVDVADDMLPLRRRPEALLVAVGWSKLLTRRLMPGHPDDGLLANLYWNMRLLCVPHVPPEAAEWRFLWRWLAEWGLAPDMGRCLRCGRGLILPDAPPDQRAAWTGEGLVCSACDADAQGALPSFTGGGLSLLLRVGGSDTEALARAFQAGRGGASPFALAARCAAGVLGNEK